MVKKSKNNKERQQGQGDPNASCDYLPNVFIWDLGV
jgi:hypothetical protein